MNRKNIGKIVLIVLAVPTLMVGMTALFDPQAIMDNVDQPLQTISAKSSTRAIYGGMHLLFGLFFVYGAFKAQRDAFLILFLYSAGFVLGRMISLFSDGQPNPFISNFIVIEAVVAIIAGWFYLSAQKLD